MQKLKDETILSRGHVGLQPFDLKNWFEGFSSRWFCIKIRTFNRPRAPRFALLIIIMNPNTKSTAREPFEPIFWFEGLQTYPERFCRRIPFERSLFFLVYLDPQCSWWSGFSDVVSHRIDVISWSIAEDNRGKWSCRLQPSSPHTKNFKN
jgi:hypothetical protein